jgi:hypothetical protein
MASGPDLAQLSDGVRALLDRVPIEYLESALAQRKGEAAGATGQKRPHEETLPHKEPRREPLSLPYATVKGEQLSLTGPASQWCKDPRIYGDSVAVGQLIEACVDAFFFHVTREPAVYPEIWSTFFLERLSCPQISSIRVKFVDHGDVLVTFAGESVADLRQCGCFLAEAVVRHLCGALEIRDVQRAIGSQAGLRDVGTLDVVGVRGEAHARSRLGGDRQPLGRPVLKSGQVWGIDYTTTRFNAKERALEQESNPTEVTCEILYNKLEHLGRIAAVLRASPQAPGPPVTHLAVVLLAYSPVDLDAVGYVAYGYPVDKWPADVRALQLRRPPWPEPGEWSGRAAPFVDGAEFDNRTRGLERAARPFPVGEGRERQLVMRDCVAMNKLAAALGAATASNEHKWYPRFWRHYTEYFRLERVPTGEELDIPTIGKAKAVPLAFVRSMYCDLR